MSDEPESRPLPATVQPAGSVDRSAPRGEFRQLFSRHAPRLGLLVLGVALVALAVLALTKLGIGTVLHALVNVDVGWLIVAIALDGISLTLRALSWQAVLRAAGIDARLPQVVRATMIGVLGSAVAPARAGEPLRAWLIARRTPVPGRNFGTVLGTVFSQTLLNLVALAALTLVVVVSAGLFRQHVTAVAVGLAIPMVVAGLIVLAPTLIRRATGARWAPLRAAAGWLHIQATQLRRGLRAFVDPRLGPVAAIFQLAAWGVQLFAVYAISLALGIENQAGIIAAAAVLLAVNVTAVVPVTPSNLGVFQAATVAVLAAYGVGPGRGLAFGVLLQAVEVATAMLLGVPALIGEGLHWRDLRRVAAPAQPSG